MKAIGKYMISLACVKRHDIMELTKKKEGVFMEKKVLEEVIAKTQELMQAPTCCQELKDMAQSWLDAVGTDQEAGKTQDYLKELKEDIMPIDQLIQFASSKEGSQYFGEDTAKGIVEHSLDIKAQGAKYCDCPACQAVEFLLDRLDH